MANILLNKPATASNSFAPFLPARAADGSITDPKSRWVCSQLPAWLCVDLQGSIWISQWTTYFMGSVGWAANYNLCDFKLQGSLDNTNWFDMDTVTGNTANLVNRNITPRLVRYLRVYITKGLAANNQVSSIVDFQASESSNAPFLANLVPTAGSLNPGFASRTFNYSIGVANTVSSIMFTLTAMQPNMTIKVNNTTVVSGQQTQAINLQPGSNTVTIEVTSADSTMKTTYTVLVTKAGDSNLQLNSVDVAYAGRNITPGTVNVPMDASKNSYDAKVPNGASTITVTPHAQDSTVKIQVNGNNVQNNGTSGSVTLATPGATVVSINLTSSEGSDTRNYTLNIIKG